LADTQTYSNEQIRLNKVVWFIKRSVNEV